MGRVRLGLVAALALLVPAGSSLAGATVRSSTTTPPGSTVPDELAADALDELVDRLATTGIEVFTDPTAEPLVPAAEPRSPMRLLLAQVAAMELELRSGAGIPVDILDAEVGAASEHDDGVGSDAIDASTGSALITAWMDVGGTPASMLALELVDGFSGRADPVSIDVIPNIVLVLFASDMAMVGASLPDTAADQPSGWRHRPEIAGTLAASAGGDLCSSAVAFVNNVVASVFDAIGHLADPPAVHTGFGLFDTLVNGLATFAVGGVNAVIDGANFIVSNTVTVAIKTVLSYVGRIAAVVGTVSIVVSAIRPWTFKVDADPPNVEAPGGGSVRARVELGGFDEWPPLVAGCARAAGVPLPPLRPSGNPVTWSVATGNLITPDAVDAALRADGTATYAYHVIAPPPLPDGPNVVDEVPVRATVQRDDFRRLEEQLLEIIRREFAQLVPPIGSIVSPLVMPLVKPWIDTAFETLSHLRDVYGVTRIAVRHPDPTQPTTTLGTTTTVARLALPDPCSLITQAEAEAAYGAPTQAGVSRSEVYAALGTGLLCAFPDAGPDPVAMAMAFVSVGVVDLGDDAAAKFAAYATAMAQLNNGSVEELGDDNFYISAGAEDAANLFVRKQNLVIIVTVLLPGGLERATHIAGLALERL